MERIIIPIRKMHCRSCEILIEQELKKVPGIERVKASTLRAHAAVYIKETLDLPLAHSAIRAAGYEVGGEDGPERPLWFTRDSDVYGNILLAAFLLFCAYVVVRMTGVLRFAGAVSGGADVAGAVLIGITAGLSTCMALVGGLVLGASARHAEKHPEGTTMQKLRPHFFFNMGRAVGFFILGGILGALGGVIVLTGPPLGVLTMIIAVVMVLLGVQLLEVSPALNRFKLTLPPALSRMLGIADRAEQEYSHKSAMMLGALTFFLPCGFTQLMQVNAVASGSFLKGGLLLMAFAIGTAPGLLGIGWLTSVVKGSSAQLFFKFAGLLVIAFAVFNFQNGYRLTGWDPPAFLAGSAAPVGSAAAVENGTQVIRMKETWSGYEPNSFTVRAGVPVRWVIDAEAPYSCASSLVVPSLRIQRSLKPGENIIEFTPTQPGTIRFSCSMGMYAGVITVTP